MSDVIIIDDMATEEETTIATTASLSDAMQEHIQSYAKSINRWLVIGQHKFFNIHACGLIVHHDETGYAKVVQPSIYYNHPHLEMDPRQEEDVFGTLSYVTAENRKDAIELRDMLKTYYTQLYDELDIE